MSSPPFGIRPATPEDEPFLWRMLTLAASMSGSVADVDEAMRSPDLRCYAEGFGRAGDVGVVAIESASRGALLGAAWGRLGASEPSSSKLWTHDTPELAIATEPHARGRGVGSALLIAFLEAATAARFTAVVLSVREGNPAVRLYERAGFVTERRIVNRVGGVSLAMRRRLP